MCWETGVDSVSGKVGLLRRRQKWAAIDSLSYLDHLPPFS
jgi:hypothetical protein